MLILFCYALMMFKACTKGSQLQHLSEYEQREILDFLSVYNVGAGCKKKLAHCRRWEGMEHARAAHLCPLAPNLSESTLSSTKEVASALYLLKVSKKGKQ
jgi:hypothetical protein